MKRLLAVLTAAVVPLAVVQAPAQAAATGWVKVNPRASVLKAKASTVVTVTSHLDHVGVNDMVDFFALGPKNDGYTDSYVTAGPNGNFTAKMYFDPFNQPGTWHLTVILHDYDKKTLVNGPTTTFTVKLSDKITVKPSAKRVKKGHKVTLKGELTGLSETSHSVFGLTPLKNRKVTFYFRKKGTRTWVKEATATTNAKGLFHKALTDRATGTWRVRFAGTATIAPTYHNTGTITVH